MRQFKGSENRLKELEERKERKSSKGNGGKKDIKYFNVY
jgi:hypothetical protein